MATWTYTVTYIGSDTNTAINPTDDAVYSAYPYTTDITSSVISIEKMTDVGSGEVNSATLILNARHGNFITADSGTVATPVTPILDEFDKIKIVITDKNGDSYRRIFEVDELTPKKTIQEGIRLEVQLLGQERCLQQTHFAKQYYYANAYEVTKDIVDKYNLTKGSSQVEVQNQDNTTYNTLPKWTANNYDFGSNELICYDGLTDVIDKLGTTIAGGGANDYFELGFDDPDKVVGSQDDTKINFKAFSSGSFPTSSLTTLENVTTLPIYNTEGTIESKSGTVVIGKGAEAFGTFPSNASRFAGLKEAFELIPEWQSGVTYPKDVRVQKSGTRYTSDIADNTSTPPTNWTSITADDLIGSDFRYSPFTKIGSSPSGLDGYKAWKNCGSAPNYSSGTFTKQGCWDSNLVIMDEVYYRNWVDCKIASDPDDSLLDDYKFETSSGSGVYEFYRGFRLLVTGSLSNFDDPSGTALSGSGKPIQYDGTGWNVIKEPDGNDQIAVIDLGKNYIYNTGTTTWDDDSATEKGNDCFHIYNGMNNFDGVSELANGSGTADDNYGYKSAVESVYEFNPWVSVLNFIPLPTVPNYYSIGAWINFRFPFPSNSYNSQEIGELYGGVEKPDQKYEPVTFDTTNMHLLPNGDAGFNKSDTSGTTGYNKSNSQELGTCDAIKFWIKLKWYYMVGVTETQTGIVAGDYKMRIFCYDTSSNVVTFDFTISHDANWQEVIAPLSSFKIYRARATLRWGAIATNLIVPELEILNIFEWKNLRMIGIQLQESYDTEARYDASQARYGNPQLNFATYRLKMSVDNFCFEKQLLATSGTDTVRNIEPKFLERPFTTNFQQLQTDVDTQKIIEEFRYQAFEIEGEGECDPNLQFGYSFYLKDNKMTNLSDSGSANTIKLVAKRIEYTINGTDGGTGGFVRKIVGVKRLS